MKRLSIFVSFVFVAAAAFADTDGYIRRDSWGQKAYPAAPHVVEQASFEPAITLSAEGALEQIEAVHEWNAAGKLPARGGFERQIPDVMTVMVHPAVASKGLMTEGRGVAMTTDSGSTIWGTKIRVLGAARLRVRLDDVKVPAGTVMWVYGNDGREMAFDSDLIDVNGGIWAPSVNGDTVHLEIEIPTKSDQASFTIHRLIQLLPLATTTMIGKPNDDASCLIDANCVNSSTFPGIEIARHAIAHMEIPVGGGFVGLCTGGLLNDTKQSGTPYFLSASHCFGDDQNPANHPDQVQGMEIYFEYRTASCGSQSANALTPTVGARLLASSTANDYAFFQLNSIPNGRGFLGWSASPVASGTTLFRISHPAPSALGGDPQPQVFTQTTATGTTGQSCTGSPRTQYIYQNLTNGATYGGSSGSPVMLSDGKVVGQLYGKCGPTPNDGCDKANFTVDGAFAPNFAAVYQQYLAPATGGVCTPTSTTICLSNGRFAVSVQYRDQGVLKDATAIKYTDASGLFWFFGADNIEILMKILNACSITNSIWVFSAATTNVEFHLKVVDTKNGTVKTYDTVSGPPAPAITDTNAFKTCP